MATAYNSDAITNNQPARLVSIGLTPKYEEFDPATLADDDTFDMFLVPGGVRITDGFIKAVGGTGLDVHGTPTLNAQVEIIDDVGTVVVIGATSGIRATGGAARVDTNEGYLVVSARNNAIARVHVTDPAATLGTSKIALYLEWSSYTDD